MRERLQTLLKGNFSVARSAHAGLLHERFAPLGYRDDGHKGEEIGKVLKDSREDFLKKVAQMAMPGDIYRAAFTRWLEAITATGAALCWVESTSRLLVGHGNPAPSEVGIALHPTYGVPYLPGTGLKGLLNHYLAEWGTPVDERWSGVQYDADGRPAGRPGEWHRHLFGEPNLPSNDPRKPYGQRGHVIFEDAWMAPDVQEALVLDVVTPHQGDYYRRFGESAWPNDWTDPVPVTFLTVPPGVRFLVAVSPVSAEHQKAGELARDHLADALEAWGVGAKGRAGYGRLVRVENGPPSTHLRPESDGSAGPPRDLDKVRTAAPPAAPMSVAVQLLDAAVTRVIEPEQGANGPSLAERFEAEFGDDRLIVALGPGDGSAARAVLRRLQNHGGAKKRFGPRITQLFEGTPK